MLIEEMMKNLRLAGVSCAASVELNRDLPGNTVMELFDFYAYVIEKSYEGLDSLLARFFCRDDAIYVCVDAVCSLDLQKLQTDRISVSISEDNCYTLSFKLEGGDGR